MKTILYALVLMSIAFAGGWFSNSYFNKPKDIESKIVETERKIYLRDTVYVETKPEVVYIDTTSYKKPVETIPPIDIIYKEPADPKTVAVNEVDKLKSSSPVDTYFEYKTKRFTVKAMTHSECVVDSMSIMSTDNKEWLTEIRKKEIELCRDCYEHGTNNYPTWKKAAYFGFGIVATIVTIQTVKDITR